MEKLDINNCLFYGINKTDITCFDTLKSILSSGCIYSRKSLDKYINKTSSSNESNNVSLVYHPSNAKTNELFKKYVLSNKISLIFNEEFLRKIKSKKHEKYQLHINGNLPIKFISAIGLNDPELFELTEKMFVLKHILLKMNNGTSVFKYSDELEETENIRKLIKYKSSKDVIDEAMMNYIRISNLLHMYNLDVPIINPKYGYELADYNKQCKRIKKIENLYVSEYEKVKKYDELVK